MKENLDKDVYVNFGTVQGLVNLSRKEWEELRIQILLSNEVLVQGAEYQYSKLAFTSHIDKLKGIDRRKDE
jgi:hypothetical protein